MRVNFPPLHPPNFLSNRSVPLLFSRNGGKNKVSLWIVHSHIIAFQAGHFCSFLFTLLAEGCYLFVLIHKKTLVSIIYLKPDLFLSLLVNNVSKEQLTYFRQQLCNYLDMIFPWHSS
jgi:hypothetical protein